MVSTLSLPAVVGFLDQEYHNKSVATQISHDAGLARSALPGIETETTLYFSNKQIKLYKSTILQVPQFHIQEG
jgi:hypothetical protein